MSFRRIGYFTGNSASCQEALIALQQLHQLHDVNYNQDIDVILVIGGDGVMLRALHRFAHLNVPFYGINAGTMGFLMNKLERAASLLYSLEKASKVYIRPLLLEAIDRSRQTHKAFAFNEISVLRSSPQAAKLRIVVDEKEFMEELVADGALVATPTGSRAYNLAAGGNTLSIESNMLCLTPICSFRPQGWRGELLSNNSVVNFEVLEHEKRPINAVADFLQIDNVVSINICSDRNHVATLLFGQRHAFIDRSSEV